MASITLSKTILQSVLLLAIIMCQLYQAQAAGSCLVPCFSDFSGFARAWIRLRRCHQMHISLRRLEPDFYSRFPPPARLQDRFLPRHRSFVSRRAIFDADIFFPYSCFMHINNRIRVSDDICDFVRREQRRHKNLHHESQHPRGHGSVLHQPGINLQLFTYHPSSEHESGPKIRSPTRIFPRRRFLPSLRRP
jgi:hypothetical protein